MTNKPLGQVLKESILGAKNDELITSGTLVVTRGLGVVAVALVGTFFLMDLFEEGPWAGLDAWQKLIFVLAAGFIWAIVASADAIARGRATASQHDLVAALPAGLKATKTKGTDDPNWWAAAVKFSANEGAGGPEYLIVKDGKPAEWVSVDDLSFP